MKNTTVIQLGTILTGSLLCAALAFAATDYSAMTNEELAAQRGSMKQSTIEERNAFQNEWQSRVQKMGPEEKQKFMGQGENGQGMRSEKQERNQERMQQRQEQGSGMGGGMGSGGGGSMGGMGSGSGMGGRGSMGGGRR